MYPNGLLMGFEFQNSHKKLKLFTLKYKLYLPFSPFLIRINEAVICGLTPEKACNIKEFAA